MKYQVINKTSLVDGPGVRCALYVSGCSIHCVGCHNKEAWDFTCGTDFNEDTISMILKFLEPSYIKGLSLLGGEPYDQADLHLIVKLVRLVKEHYPNKDIWIWTGYEFDQIKYSPLTKYIDVAVCGRFDITKRDISDANRWRGSTNQRVIDVKTSLENNKLIGLSGIPNNEV